MRAALCSQYPRAEAREANTRRAGSAKAIPEHDHFMLDDPNAVPTRIGFLLIRNFSMMAFTSAV